MRSVSMLCFCVAALGNQALGAVYVKDPVPIGATGYTAGKLPSQNPSTNAIVGFNGAWSGGTGTILVKTANLSYPPNVNLSSVGGSLGITYTTSGDTTGRSTSRSISGAGLPTSGTLYFSALLNVDATAMSKLANGQAYFIGVSRTDYNASDATVVSFPATGVHIGFKKVSGIVTLSLGVNGTSYPIIASATAGETYFCVVEIQLNAGDAGKEIVTPSSTPPDPT